MFHLSVQNYRKRSIKNADGRKDSVKKQSKEVGMQVKMQKDVYTVACQTNLIPELIQQHFEKTGQTPRNRTSFMPFPRDSGAGTITDNLTQRRLDLRSNYESKMNSIIEPVHQ